MEIDCIVRTLDAAPAAKVQWMDLTPLARRDFIMWIDAAKQTETRKHRIERTCDMLANGKRRPCCFSVVPLDLHLALKAAPVAKGEMERSLADAAPRLHQLDRFRHPAEDARSPARR